MKEKKSMYIIHEKKVIEANLHIDSFTNYYINQYLDLKENGVCNKLE